MLSRYSILPSFQMKGKVLSMNIRRAENKDMESVLNLLSQVLEVHAVIRPDLFISGTRKYTEKELEVIFADDQRPVFVAEEDGRVLGYCFCVIQDTQHSNNLRDSRSLYIDDLCVDEKSRHQHVGRALIDYVSAYGRSIGCYDMSLNVWEGNDQAKAFYERLGFTPRKVIMEKLL